MSDYVSSREFGRSMDSVDSRFDRTDSQLQDVISGQKDLIKAQQKFFTKQAVINADFASIKKKYSVVTTALIVLMVGTVYGKITTEPAITQHEEPKKAEIKPVTKDLIK